MPNRREDARVIRLRAAEHAYHRGHHAHKNNGEEYRYRNAENRPAHLANFTKGLPHNQNGFLFDPDHYERFVHGIQSGDPADFERTPLGPALLGEPDPEGRRRPVLVDGEQPQLLTEKTGVSAKERANYWYSTWARGEVATAPTPADVRAWESAGAGHTYDLQGPDAQAVTMPGAPTLDSPALILEMAEVYLMALLRDVPFSELRDGGTDVRVQRAMDILTAMSAYDDRLQEVPPTLRHQLQMINVKGRQAIFRGVTPGERVGPYISQFLLIGNRHLQDRHDIDDGYIQYGAMRMDQRVRIATPQKDYMTTFEAWVDVQNGADLRGYETYENEEDVPKKYARDRGYRFMTTPRDLATYVHYDALYQAYLNACILMLAMKVPFDRGIPFQAADNIDRQQGFAHFGGPHILSLVTEVATRALKAVRYQKFNVHRRARPEAVAGLIHLASTKNLSNVASSNQKVLEAVVSELNKTPGAKQQLLQMVEEHNQKQNEMWDDRKNDPSAKSKSYLLPMAFPEGSPMHPSYGAGHGTVAGACVTILKAYFDHGYVLQATHGTHSQPHPFAFEAVPDGQTLRTAPGDLALTVEGELNKLAANIAIGRNWAGVHYYSDYIESLRMGEQIALGILEEQKLCYRENFEMTVPLFDGTVVRI